VKSAAQQPFEPVFTVVMPAYNAAATIAPAIRSVLAQTRVDWELIVVDDGSTDDTVAQVTPFLSDPRIQLVPQENRGLSSARNTAIALARGRYISMLDSDDLWMPSYLDAMGRVLARDADVAFAHTDAWALDDATRRIRRSSTMSPQRPPNPPPSEPREFLALLLQRNFLYYGATIRRKVLEHVGLYDERLRRAEDYELWLRILAHGYRGERAHGLLAVRRERADSLSSTTVDVALGMKEVYRIVAEEYDVPEPIREQARAAMRACDRRIALVTGERRLAAAALNLRRRLGPVKRAVLRRRLWYSAPPSAVAKAFPDLREL
jgi:GT2 family glycosyltransferase